MMPEVLAVLVSIILVCFGGMQQGQAEGVVVRLVPAVFAVIQDRHAIVSTTVSQIGPILCIDFVGSLRIVAPPHTSKSQIVGGFRICHVQRKFGLQQSIGQLPVHLIVKVYAVGTATLIQTDVLLEE